MILAAMALALQAMPLDSFETLTPWSATGSDGVAAGIDQVTNAQALRLSYDFGAVSGYAVARRTLPIVFPPDFEITLKVRGTGGVNDLQIKFVDASGTNVWWYRRANFHASPVWQTIHIRARDVEFAWGPTTDKRVKQDKTVEIVVARGRDGGKGTLEIADLNLVALDPPKPLPPLRSSDAAAIDGNPATAWEASGGAALKLDFGGRKSLGGLILHWTTPASRYGIEASDDGKVWRSLREVTDSDGGDDPIALPGTETRYLRIALPGGAPAARLGEIDIKPLEWAATPNTFVAALAQAAPRGTFPRGFSGEQPYWTLVGTNGGHYSGLIGEDGAIEIAKGGFSIEPFVLVDGRRYGWADVTSDQTLEQGYLPIPHVRWRLQDWTLDTSVFSDVTTPRLMATWRLTNSAIVARCFKLVLAVRPFQVNPPAQFLGAAGGVSAISGIVWDRQLLSVTTPPAIEGDTPITRALQPLTPPTKVATAAFDRGALSLPIDPAGGLLLNDPTGLGSAALTYDLTIPAGRSVDVRMAIPFDQTTSVPDAAEFERAYAATSQSWHDTLGTVSMTAPPAKQAVVDTVRTALAHILMSRDGVALKPGTRSYDRSWIRDGAMISDSLLRLGAVAPARAFADWYGGKLFANGKVPCCVDARGADPVPENDAPGEYIHLVTQLYRFTGDRAALAADWPRLDAARRYMETLRQSERTTANLTPERRMRYGLMPASISHEGYSTQAQYSLWDDFWALTGYKDAADAARIIGRPELGEVAAARDEFNRDLHAAIAASVVRWGIDYIPGATSLGDFDATSTTIALDPAGELAGLDRRLLETTFEMQWARVTARGAAGADWADYTPYELRNVSAFLRLGWRVRANQLLDIYMKDRRPAAWNGWAEVVGREPREVRFIGDMPHAWVASDFIRAALDIFAYTRGDDQTIVLAAGLDESWLRAEGASIANVRTAFGSLSLRGRIVGDGVTIDISGTAMPPGGFLLTWPLESRAGVAHVDGTRAKITPQGLHLEATGKPIRVFWHSR